MLNQLNMSGLDKVETAIERLRLFEPEEGYYLAFSGGKDSVVIKALAHKAWLRGLPDEQQSGGRIEGASKI